MEPRSREYSQRHSGMDKAAMTERPVAASAGSGRLELIRQVISYGLIGLASAGLDATVFWLLVSFTRSAPQLANAVGICCGITMSFSLNRRFTFDSHDQVLRRFALFAVIGLCGLALSAFILAVGLRMGYPAMTVKLFSVALVAAMQFVLNRTVTFRVR
jgi:putative flippase GtrA